MSSDANKRHTLRTPLNQIIGYSELLIDEAADRGLDGQLDDLRRINKAGKDLLALLDEAFQPEQPSEKTHDQAPAPTPHSEPVTLDEPAETSRQASILVVDDNETNRDLLSRRVERQGYQAAVAENGRQALDFLSKRAFDLVLLDILMPEMDGYQTLAALKFDPNLRNIPVIMISAVDQIESVVRCIEMGADDYLPKPFNPTLLKARISASIEKKRLRDREVRFYEEIRENYRRLKELEQLRDDLTHMIVHDLRTPLTSVIAGMQTMDILGDLNDDQKEFLEIAVSGGRTLLGMINDLLDVSKMESGSLTLERQEVQAGGIVEQSLNQVRQLAKEKELTLAHDCAEELPTLSADSEKLQRTLVNLLSNAIKFTPSGGTVAVSASAGDRGEMLFAVRDTGEGIPKESFDRIFEKFGQVESRKSGRRMSTGLGLTFCKMAVEAHGGRIWVESELGKGTTFFFALPIS
jgi:signal transduction histidine kinase